MPRTAIYAGSFDPLTNGHVTIVERGRRLFDEVVVAVATNIRKKPLFTASERIAFIQEQFAADPGVLVIGFDGLLVDLAQERDAVAILRGLRGAGDFEYEAQMVHMNRHLAPDVDTVFLLAEAGEDFVSSSLVKEVASFGGDISAFVPGHVHQLLLDRISDRA